MAELTDEAGLLGAEGSGNRAFFGPATDFVSYSWHGINCGQLLEALSSTVSEGEPEEQRFFWIDIFAVAQNETPKEDLAFEAVIAATSRSVVSPRSSSTIVSPTVSSTVSIPLGRRAPVVSSCDADSLLVPVRTGNHTRQREAS